MTAVFIYWQRPMRVVIDPMSTSGMCLSYSATINLVRTRALNCGEKFKCQLNYSAAGLCFGRTHFCAFVDGREAPTGSHERRNQDQRRRPWSQFEPPLLFYILIALALPCDAPRKRANELDAPGMPFPNLAAVFTRPASGAVTSTWVRASFALNTVITARK
jgi:hypothetical protein